VRLREWIRLNPTLSDEHLATRILEEDPELAQRIVEREVAHERRKLTHELEQEAIAALLRAYSTSRAPSPDDFAAQSGAVREEFERAVALAVAEREAIKALLDEPFSLGDGTRVTWGDATVEQHLQRIELLREQIRGQQETLARHEVAVRILKEANAPCLRAVPWIAY